MNISSKQARAAAVASAFALAAILGACGDDDETPTVTTTTEASGASDTTAEPGGEELQITGAWARTSPSMAAAGAVYLVIDNPTDSDDVLLSASVDPEIAATVELHESKMADDSDDMSDESGEGMDDNGMDDNGMDDDADDMSDGSDDMGDGDDMPGGGMMTMTPVDQISVPAGSSVALEPGGLHIMLLDLAAPLEAGTTIEVTLTFENAGEVVVNADVQDTAP